MNLTEALKAVGFKDPERIKTGLAEFTSKGDTIEQAWRQKQYPSELLNMVLEQMKYGDVN
jgi:hypothetical protein